MQRWSSKTFQPAKNSLRKLVDFSSGIELGVPRQHKHNEPKKGLILQVSLLAAADTIRAKPQNLDLKFAEILKF